MLELFKMDGQTLKYPSVLQSYFLVLIRMVQSQFSSFKITDVDQGCIVYLKFSFITI